MKTFVLNANEKLNQVPICLPPGPRGSYFLSRDRLNFVTPWEVKVLEMLIFQKAHEMGIEIDFRVSEDIPSGGYWIEWQPR